MKDDELKELFVAEASEGSEELNMLFAKLEKSHSDKKAIDNIFRITHTIKANASAMGYHHIADMAHVMEDIFAEIRKGSIVIEEKIFNDLFKANDLLVSMIQNIKSAKPEQVKYKGLKTKLEVLIRNSKEGYGSIPSQKIKSAGEKVLNQNIEINNKPDLTNDDDTPKNKITDPLPDTNLSEDIISNDLVDGTENKLTFSDIIQIPVKKLDNLMNLVGELLIERDRVITSVQSTGRKNEFSRLMRITSELQYSVMNVRLVQLNILFNKIHRVVRDTAVIEDKRVNLIIEGAETEIDRNVLQIISDSLVHIVRNAISHGIESPAQRLALGKNEIGSLTISATSEKETIVIKITDDGKGINHDIIKSKAIEKGIINADFASKMTKDQIINLVFEPGFSSSDKITSVSGRGVGMDVVKKSMDAIGAKVKITTEVNAGTTIELSLPSSMALKAALLFELDNNEFAIPLTYTEAVIQLQKKDIHKINKGLIATYLNKNISIVFLSDIFHDRDNSYKQALQHTFDKLDAYDRLYVIIVSYGGKDVGFVVDRLLQQKEIVEKPLEKPLENIKFISGATILGNGNVCLVLDIPSVITELFKVSKLQYNDN
ncbi:MAG: chemotaxis protein CheA [Cytophagales bacterium]|nr:chemotaxis protein CheA [Cytophagales bacterium]